MAKNNQNKEDQEDRQNTESDTINLGKIFASWEIPEFIKPERNKKWYIYFTIIALGLLAYSYFAKNPLFAIIIIIFSIIYFISEKRGPNQVSFMLTEDGIVLGQKLIEYKELENFYIIYYPPKIKNIYLQPKTTWRSRITIPILDQNPVEIRKILLSYLSEDTAKEEMPASESISEILKL